MSGPEAEGAPPRRAEGRWVADEVSRGGPVRRGVARLGSLARQYKWPLLGLAALVVFLLGFLEGTEAWDTRAFRSFKLFLLDAPTLDGEGYGFRVARYLAPLISASATVVAFAALSSEQVDALLLRFKRGHIVVCGLDEKGARIAVAASEAGASVAAVERDPTRQSVRTMRRAGIPVVIGDGRDPLTLQAAGVAKARQLITVCGDDATDASVAAAGAAVTRKVRPPLSVLVHVTDADLAQLLASAVTDEQVRFGFFSVDDQAATVLLDAHPVPTIEGRAPRVAVCGSNAIARRLLVHLARRRLALDDEPLSVVLRGVDGGEMDRLRAAIPLLDATLSFEDDDGTLEVDMAYVCIDGDDKCAIAALELAGSHDQPVVAVLQSDRGLAQLLAATEPARSGQLNVFGVLDRVCRFDLLRGGLLELLARALHGDYSERLAATRPDDPLAGQGWDDLSEELQESNRHAASGLARSLWSQGWSLVPLADRTAAEVVLPAEQVERLASLEHERWRAERTAAGWTPGPRDTAARTSPHLVEWADLPEAVQEDNREAILRLPPLLVRAGVQLVWRA